MTDRMLGPKMLIAGFALMLIGFAVLVLGTPILIVGLLGAYYLATAAGPAVPAVLVIIVGGIWYAIGEARDGRAMQA